MSREEMENRQRYATEEMFNMQRRASMPPVPPFVQMPNGGGNASENENHNTPHREEPQPPRGNHTDESPLKKGFGGLFSKDLLKLIDLKNFELDSDRMLLLLMIVLLSGDESDNILLFALAYIML